MKIKTFLKYIILITLIFVFKDFKIEVFASDFENFIIIEKYQKVDGTVVKEETSTILPTHKNYTKSAPYVLNYILIDSKLDGISIGNEDVNIFINSSAPEHEIIFIYKDDKNNNGVPDDEESYTIIEKYQNPNGDSLQDDSTSAVILGETYTKEPPLIKNYVVSDVKIDGNLIDNIDVVITDVSENHEIIFIYKDDKNNNGIPDDEENYTITEKYQMPDGSSIQSDTVTYIRLIEDYSKIAPNIKNYVIVDVKVDGNLTGQKEVTITNVSEKHEVIFIYKDDKNNNGIPDDEEIYTITEKYQKTDGTTIQNDTNTSVKSGENYTKTAPIIMNYVAVNSKLNETLTGKKAIEITNVLNNHEAIFIYKDDKNNNGIPDDEESYKITEKYQKSDGSKIQDDFVIVLKKGENHFKAAPSIKNYVASDVKLNGVFLGKKEITITDVSQNHEIIFIYKNDKNNNGIPDEDEIYTITEKYQKPNGVSLNIDTITDVRVNDTYFQSPLEIEDYVAVDVKINGKTTGKTEVTIENVQAAYEITFIYEDDKNNNGIPDSKESFTIIEKYQKEDGTSIKSDEIVSLKGGENYSKIPPKIDNYDVIGIIIDGEEIEDSIATIDNLSQDHEVVFLYKKVAVSKPVIDPITPGDTIITGLGTPGNRIDVEFENGVKKSTDVNVDGTWSVEVLDDIELIPENTVIAQETDRNGNKSDEGLAVVLDYPLEPTIIEPIKPSDNKINGVGEPSKEIVVVFSDGRSQSSLIELNGNWEVSVPNGLVLKSEDIITAYVVDKNGNKSVEAMSIVIDSAKPSPKVNTITPGDKTISGKGEAGNTINLTLPDGAEIKDIVINNSGNWKIDIKSNLRPGDLVKIVERNKDGIVSDNVFSKVLDYPKIPTVNSIVNPNSTTITGEGEARKQIILVFPDGTEAKENIGANNKWIVSIPKQLTLKSGDLIKAYAQDKNENKSSVYIIKVSTGETPVLEINTNKMIDVNGSFDPKSLITKARDTEDGQNLIDKVEISGTVDTKKIGSYTLEFSLTDSDGNAVKSKGVVSVKSKNTVLIGDIAIDAQDFNILTKFVPSITDAEILENSKATAWNVQTGDDLRDKIIIDKSKLKIAEGTFPVYFSVDILKAVKSKDTSGNDAAAIDVQVFEQEPPVVDLPIKATHMYISGSSDKGDKIIVTFPNGSKKDSQIGDNGKWIVPVPDDVTLKAKDKIKVYSENQKGNKSPEVIVLVLDTNLPTPKPANITPGDKTIVGEGERGNKIEVTFQDGIKSEVTINDAGNWKVSVPEDSPLQQGNVIRIIEKDKISNNGNEISIEVGKFSSNLKITRPLKESDKIIKGVGTPGNNIVITFRNGTTSYSTINKDGVWTVSVPLSIVLSTNDKVISHEEDSKGNSSNADTTLVVSEFKVLPGEV